jgi:hypothetical protein
MSRRQTVVLTGSVIAGVLACAAGLTRIPQLIGFASPHAHDAVYASEFREPAIAQAGLPAHTQMAHAAMIKAVMTPQPLEADAKTKLTNSARPLQRSAALHTSRRHDAAQQRAWIVMTDWSDPNELPQLVLTVAQSNDASQHRGQHKGAKILRVSYAAVPIPDGWLIVEI